MWVEIHSTGASYLAPCAAEKHSDIPARDVT